MGGRQISHRHREWLDNELVVWQQDGLIESGQVARILSSYETVAATGERKLSRGRFVLQALAVFLVGLAALLLVGYNWEELHWIAKLGLVFSSVAASHSAGFYFLRHRSAQRAAEIAFFLGCLFYGAGIWLVAQVFHLDSHYPDGVWWWAVGVLPFALSLDTLLLHVLFAGLLALWSGMEVTGFSHLSPWLFFHWWPNGAYSVPLLTAPGLLWGYRRGSAATVGLYLALISFWVVLQGIAWNLEWQSVYLVGLVGALFLIVAENHRHGSPLAVPYRTFGGLFVAGALIPASFADFHRSHFRYGVNDDYEHQVYGVMVFVILAALVAFSLLLKPLTVERASQPFARLWEVATRQWIPLGLVVVLALSALLAFGGDQGIIMATVLANVAMIGLSLWLIRVGLREEQGRVFAAGIFYFLLWTVLRYSDLFGAAGGMLGAALMFFLCGAALFFVAMFWGKRKEVRHA